MSVCSVTQLNFVVCLTGSGEQTRAGLVPIASTLLPQCHRLACAADGACNPQWTSFHNVSSGLSPLRHYSITGERHFLWRTDFPFNLRLTG